MSFSLKTALFTVVLTLVTTLCKYFFGPEITLSGFSPVLAIALFSGFVFRRSEWVFFFSIVALLVSDLSIQVLYLNDLFDYQGIYAGQWKKLSPGIRLHLYWFYFQSSHLPKHWSCCFYCTHHFLLSLKWFGLVTGYRDYIHKRSSWLYHLFDCWFAILQKFINLYTCFLTSNPCFLQLYHCA